MTVEEMLRAERFNPCGKCGGYATRRLTEEQIAYYRAAYRVHEIARRVRWTLAHRDLASDTASLLAELKDWDDRPPADEWFETKGQGLQWRRIVSELHQQALVLS
ncbi:hypothetical protein [Streptomyces sioyaensis]|uniref:hypothetical protein n=1 Tax=Streptomyces sioyaensis TaxID=67364 RepID=UPI0037AB04EA